MDSVQSDKIDIEQKLDFVFQSMN